MVGKPVAKSAFFTQNCDFNMKLNGNLKTNDHSKYDVAFPRPTEPVSRPSKPVSIPLEPVSSPLEPVSGP